MIVRLLRITGVGLGLAFLFHLSQAAILARGEQPVAGTLWAIGVVSLLFLVRAILMERTRGPRDNMQKDLLWGLAAGGVLTVLARL